LSDLVEHYFCFRKDSIHGEIAIGRKIHIRQKRRIAAKISELETAARLLGGRPFDFLAPKRNALQKFLSYWSLSTLWLSIWTLKEAFGSISCLVFHFVNGWAAHTSHRIVPRLSSVFEW
jgi:hypothetical protein